MTAEICGGNPDAGAQNIGWRCDEPPRYARQSARDGTRVRKIAEPRREINAMGNQILTGVIDTKVDAQLRMLSQKFRQARNHFTQRKARRERDP